MKLRGRLLLNYLLVACQVTVPVRSLVVDDVLRDTFTSALVVVTFVNVNLQLVSVPLADILGGALNVLPKVTNCVVVLVPTVLQLKLPLAVFAGVIKFERISDAIVAKLVPLGTLTPNATKAFPILLAAVEKFD